MFARATLFEIDTVRISLEDAERIFLEKVVPVAKQQPGYRGLCVMRTSEGKGMVLSLWESEEAAQSGIESGFYQEQVAQFVTFMRQPPGREQYEVIYWETAPTPDAAHA
jgi:heme-degrading monooxygenase HmoA